MHNRCLLALCAVVTAMLFACTPTITPPATPPTAGPAPSPPPAATAPPAAAASPSPAAAPSPATVAPPAASPAAAPSPAASPAAGPGASPAPSPSPGASPSPSRGAAPSPGAFPSPAALRPLPPPPPGGPEKATLVLDWQPNTNHTGVYVAKRNGWYDEAGVDLAIEIPSDPSASLKLVGAGQTEFGINYQSSVMLARAQGVPIVSIAPVNQGNNSAFAVTQASGATRPKELEGKRFGSAGLNNFPPILKTVMQCDGGDDSKVEVINIGFNNLAALQANRVDAVFIYPFWEGVQFELLGLKMNYLPITSYCVPENYSPTFVAGESTLANKPELVRRFLAATARGYEWAAANPDAAADILLQAVPELDPQLVHRSQTLLSPFYVKGTGGRWGVQDAAVWRRYADWMQQNGLLDRPVDPDKAFVPLLN